MKMNAININLAIKVCYQTSKFLLVFVVPLIGLAVPSESFAHRTSENVIDNCRIRVGSEVIHFTAYTPYLTKNREYCQSIPELGVTSLVFDYEGKQLRHVSVEFEVTKEPAGTRVFHQEPKKIKTGTVNGAVDFTGHGAGDYLIHVTIVDGDKKLDSHLPIKIGIDTESDYAGWILPIIGLLFIIAMLYFVIRNRNNKSDDATGSTD